MERTLQMRRFCFFFGNQIITPLSFFLFSIFFVVSFPLERQKQTQCFIVCLCLSTFNQTQKTVSKMKKVLFSGRKESSLWQDALFNLNLGSERFGSLYKAKGNKHKRKIRKYKETCTHRHHHQPICRTLVIVTVTVIKYK